MKPRSRFRGLTLLVTVGTTRFDQLIKKILNKESVEQLAIMGFARLILQIGKSEYEAEQVEPLRDIIEIEIYDYKPSLLDDIDRADVVVGHAGAGTCLEVLRMNRRLLLVVNETLMDNHQRELAEQLTEDKYVLSTSVDELNANLDAICETKLLKFPPKSNKFDKIFDEALERSKR